MTDDSIRTSEELEKQVALPLLGMTPELAQDKTVSRSSTCLSASRKSWHLGRFNWPPSWESLDLIYKNIQLLNSVSSFQIPDGHSAG